MADNLNSDLSGESVDEYFRERDERLADAIKNMESVETWTLDRNAEVQDALQRFADKAGEAEFEDADDELKQQLVVLLGYISSGKAIKLLMWIEQKMPHFVARTLAEAQLLGAQEKINVEVAKLFVERFFVLERLHLLAEVFDEERLDMVQKVLKLLRGEEIDDDEE